jgi:hypothetical protein
MKRRRIAYKVVPLNDADVRLGRYGYTDYRDETDREFYTRMAKGWSVMAVLYLAAASFLAATIPTNFTSAFIAANIVFLGIAAFCGIFWLGLSLLDSNP